MSERWQKDSPREECGVFGIYAPDMDVARLTFFGLFALQHRGQESAGIAVTDGSRLVIDYSWQDFGRLNSAQRFSVGFAFF